MDVKLEVNNAESDAHACARNPPTIEELADALRFGWKISWEGDRDEMVAAETMATSLRCHVLSLYSNLHGRHLSEIIDPEVNSDVERRQKAHETIEAFIALLLRDR